MTQTAIINKSDIETINCQLGRKAQGIMGVASRCELGLPQVVMTSSFIEADKPFPTLFWLSCPLKVKAVARLESEGWADALKEAIARDDLLRARLAKAHQEYKRLRQSQASSAEHPIFATGIGGVKDLEDLRGIKCLHAHYAHFLATGTNPIGKMVAEMLEAMGELKCQKRCDSR
jgi:hypothetical protein